MTSTQSGLAVLHHEVSSTENKQTKNPLLTHDCSKIVRCWGKSAYISVTFHVTPPLQEVEISEGNPPELLQRTVASCQRAQIDTPLSRLLLSVTRVTLWHERGIFIMLASYVACNCKNIHFPKQTVRERGWGRAWGVVTDSQNSIYNTVHALA